MPGTDTDSAYWTVVFGFLLAVLVLFLARPNSLRIKAAKSDRVMDRHNDDGDNDGFVPPVL